MCSSFFYSSTLEALKPDDIVDVIAPASRCHVEELEKIKQFLESWNLQCRIPYDLFGDNLFSSNSDEIRFKHLEEALTNTSSKAIWCLRGGYGSMKLIPALMKIKPPQRPKIFIGSSDITALHLFLQSKWGWPTIHGPSAYFSACNKISKSSLDILNKLLFQQTNSITLDKLIPLNQPAEKDALINAPIIGGNLSLIQASLGTPWQLDSKDKILLLEEVNERAYRIDRGLEQLKQAEILEKAKVILFGDMIGGEEPNGESLIQDAINLFAKNCHIPVLQINGVGHGFVNNPIILGCNANLRTGNFASLIFDLV